MGLIQRTIELAGIPTVSLSVSEAFTSLVRPPRAVVVKNPFGAVYGEPGNRERQLDIIKATLDAAVTIDRPGTIVELPYSWRKS